MIRNVAPTLLPLRDLPHLRHLVFVSVKNVGDELFASLGAFRGESQPEEYRPPETKTLQGVYLDDGTFVDVWARASGPPGGDGAPRIEAMSVTSF